MRRPRHPEDGQASHSRPRRNPLNQFAALPGEPADSSCEEHHASLLLGPQQLRGQHRLPKAKELQAVNAILLTNRRLEVLGLVVLLVSLAGACVVYDIDQRLDSLEYAEARRP